MAELLPVGLHLVAAMPGPGPVGASWRGLTQTPLRSAGWAPRELGPLPGRLYLPPRTPYRLCPHGQTERHPHSSARGGHCRKQVQKRTPVYFAKTKSFYSALARGSLPAPPEWSGWGGRGDRSHPLGEPPLSGFSQAGLLLPVWAEVGLDHSRTMWPQTHVPPTGRTRLENGVCTLGRSKRTSFVHRLQGPTR